MWNVLEAVVQRYSIRNGVLKSLQKITESPFNKVAGLWHYVSNDNFPCPCTYLHPFVIRQTPISSNCTEFMDGPHEGELD